MSYIDVHAKVPLKVFLNNYGLYDIAMCWHILSTFSLRLQMVHVHLSKVRDFWIIHQFLYNLNFLSASYLP